MDTLFLTLIISFIFVIIAVALLGLSWLITGKSKIQPGACGRDPTKKREKDCSTEVSCHLCEKKEEYRNEFKN